jgi:hypothetical protein
MDAHSIIGYAALFPPQPASPSHSCHAWAGPGTPAPLLTCRWQRQARLLRKRCRADIELFL